MDEPRLTARDRTIWARWQRTAAVHATTLGFQRRIEATRRVIEATLATTDGDACIMWSGGKDSTVLTHLICGDRGVRLAVASEKDDLDYPGEERYVTTLADAWGLDLTILRPSVSPVEWLRQHGSTLAGDADLHSRTAGLSKACFYRVVEDFGRPFRGVFLGLRASESRRRRLNRVVHGLLYPTRRQTWTATPLGDWSGLDILAYAESRSLPLLPLYQCVALCHADEPWRVRKSWWAPGAHVAHGGGVWLRYYFPSLFHRLCTLIADTRRYG